MARMAIKKGPTKGSGGKHRNALRGKGPTPKAEDRVYHKAYKAKQATNRRKMADPRLAARRRAAKFTSDSDDLVIGRNAVLEALRVGVPSMQLYIATRIEHDDRTREIIKLAGAQSLHLLEADRLEMDRIARSSNHQGVVLKVQPYQYSSLAELADIAERKAKADSQIADAEKLRTEAEAMKAEYEQNLRSMIESAKAIAKGVILATPYYMEPNRTDFMRARMQEYVDICARLAAEYGCIFVDFQAMYDRFLQHKHSSFIAWDRVHPNQIGAALMAKEWLAACGFDYSHAPENA